METLESFAKLKSDEPVALTIGVFDGVHLGHQKLLTTLRDQGKHSVLITFKNHPKAWILKTPTRHIHPFEQREEYLAEQQVDTLYALEFKEEIRNLNAGEFLEKCKARFNLDTLVLGHDTTIGSDRVEHPDVLQKWVPNIVKVAPFAMDGVIVSSQKIREAIGKGDFGKAAKWLGKPYVLKLGRERRKGNLLEGHDLALPPRGKWNVALNGKSAEIEVTPDGQIRVPEGMQEGVDVYVMGF